MNLRDVHISSFNLIVVFSSGGWNISMLFTCSPSSCYKPVIPVKPRGITLIILPYFVLKSNSYFVLSFTLNKYNHPRE